MNAIYLPIEVFEIDAKEMEKKISIENVLSVPTDESLMRRNQSFFGNPVPWSAVKSVRIAADVMAEQIFGETSLLFLFFI